MEHSKKYLWLLAIAFFTHNCVNATSEEKCSGNSDEKHRPRSRLFDQDFGLMLTTDHLLTSMMAPFRNPWMIHDYYRPWRHLAALEKDLGSTIKSDKDKFQINLDVQHFAPDEITVKTVDGHIVVEGKHEEKQDQHGYVSRQFVRRYAIPDGVSADTVVSQLSADGVLTVTAPKQQQENTNERIVPITQTGPVRKEAQDKKPKNTEL